MQKYGQRCAQVPLNDEYGQFSTNQCRPQVAALMMSSDIIQSDVTGRKSSLSASQITQH